MRTKYLIRDIWTYEQLIDLQEHLNDVINERLENAINYNGAK